VGTNVGTVCYRHTMAVAIKDRTLKIRVTGADDDRLRAAAAAAHTSLTEFVLSPALERADEVLGRPESIILSAQQFDAMLAALDEPVTPIPALVALASQPRRFTHA
jgi:uncharacterized protein (DUF1778 family)